jgi:acetoin utilization protein AcuB
MTSTAPRKPMVSIELDAPISRAIELMQEHDIRHLPVLDGGRLVGIVSERDLAEGELLRPAGNTEPSVAEAMTPEPYTVSPKTPLSEVAGAMAEHKYGCAVVVDAQGAVLEIFTTSDALRLLAATLPNLAVSEALARSAQ